MLEKVPHTTHSLISLTPGEKLKITKMLWECIWTKEVMIPFNNMQDTYHRNEEPILSL